MNAIQTNISGVLLLKPEVFGDERGFFFEAFNQRSFEEATGLSHTFVQDNQSRSKRNVLRGLHYQVQKPQGKLVRVISGEIFDVAVDLRSGSPNFGKYAVVRLSGENKHMVWVPPGFAHGFLVLSDYAEVLYKTTDFYAPRLERCIVWDDPDLAIPWPLTGKPILSAKDLSGTSFKETEPQELAA